LSGAQHADESTLAEILDVEARPFVSLEPGLREEAQPCRAREDAADVAVVLRTRLIPVPQEVGEVDEVARVVRIRIPDPFEVAEAAVRAVVSSVAGRGRERLAHAVGNEDGGAAGPTARGRGRRNGTKASLARQVRERDVDQAGVQPPPHP